MKSLSSNKALGAGFLAFLLATSCCWLPALALALGGASSILALSNGLEAASGPLMVIGGGFLLFGGYQMYKRREMNDTAILQSTLTCPHCGHSKEETMPTNACQFFYQCENCQTVLKPKAGDCCVYCSYGTVACPPIQNGKGEQCCST